MLECRAGSERPQEARMLQQIVFYAEGMSKRVFL